MDPDSTQDSVNDTPSPTFDEFSVPTYDDWRAVAEASLKGASFDKKLTRATYEDITLQPLYMPQDIADLSHHHTLPGQAPYVRGTSAAGYLNAPWHVSQELRYGTPESFNEALLHDLKRGQMAVNMVLDEPTLYGLDPDHATMGKVGYGGVSIASLDDLAIALKDVDLATVPVYIKVGALPLPLLGFLLALAKQQNVPCEKLTGGVGADPLGALAERGRLPRALGDAYDEMAKTTAWVVQNAPKLTTMTVRTTIYANSGASAVQELAYGLATAVEYIRALGERDISVDTVSAHMRFSFGIGGQFFMEIAKFRAAKLLWSQVVDAFGGSDDAQKMKLHARTGILNKTLSDPYVNMLRTTTEALSAALGGVVGMHVAPFDEAWRLPDEFSRRIARNQQLILQEEVNLTRLIDPAGGSWYVEYLTDQIARKAWALFQQIEAQGGMLAALENEIPQTQIQDVVNKRIANLKSRRDKLVGTNMYANIDEKRLDGDKFNYTEIHKSRGLACSKKREAAHLDKAAISTRDVDSLIESVTAGATLGQIARVLHVDADASPLITPLHQQRVAEPFEALRKVAAQYAKKQGVAPQIFMANMGKVVQHKARADFSIAFFETGGFELIKTAGDGFDTPQAAAEAALASGVGAMIICSTDDTYPELVPPLLEAVKAQKPDMVVILAGYPQAQIETFKAAGVDEFIHIKANCYDVNAWLQEQLGMRV